MNLGDSARTSILVECLRDDDSEVRAAAVGALEDCGTVEAVEPLLELSGSSLNHFLKNDINSAVAKIKSRIGGAVQGMLSVSKGGDMEGALSRDDAPGEGALSGDKEK